MKPKIFLAIAILVVVITLCAVNWDQVKAAAAKMGATGATGGTAGKSTTPLTAVTNTSTGQTTVVNTAPGVDQNKLLAKGSKGTEVNILQQMLNLVNTSQKRISAQLIVDGDFGSKTETMLKAYNNGIGQITLNQAYAAYKSAIGL